MLKRVALLTFAALGLFAADPAPPPQPVFIVLYSRFFDHTHPRITDERLQRLLPMLEKLHNRYPQSGISALLQFSGTVSQDLDERNPGLHLVDQIKDLSGRRLVDVGYTGEDEPSYLYRPKPKLLEADTPEERWTAKAEASERFLNDFKNPVTGLPVPGLTGGLKRTLEVFGDVAFATGIVTALGGDSPSTHEIRRMLPTAVLGGIPGPDSRRGIEGFGVSANQFSHMMSPDATTTPEVFWEDTFLRLSDTSLNDNKPHSTDEGADALKKVFQALDRSHVRVIKLEVTGYRRYLRRRPDGSAYADPLEWLYYHPDDPEMPAITMKPLVTQTEIEAGYKKEEAALNWLLEEFLPANPGSRFLSVRELAQMAVAPPGNINSAQLQALASNLNERFATRPMEIPNFVTAGDRYFSLAESFNLLVQALGGAESVPFTPIYGPMMLPNDMGLNKGSVTVAEVVKAAAGIAPQLADTKWSRVPANAVPITIEVGALRVNAAQFLHLMAQAYLDPSPETTLAIIPVTLHTQAGFMFPKNTPITDQSNAWAFKPAPLRLTPAETSAAAQ